MGRNGLRAGASGIASTYPEEPAGNRDRRHRRHPHAEGRPPAAAALRRRLPEAREVRLGARTVAVIHDAGAARGRLGRMRARFPAADAVVFGHSHLPLHEEEGGFQIFNPGS
ncbi:MAG: metallophosphoesterase family protein, partial [Solirubrobacterales bacterium]